MIYVFKYIYTWLLPPAIFVLLLLWLSWRLWRKARDQAGLDTRSANGRYCTKHG